MTREWRQSLLNYSTTHDHHNPHDHPPIPNSVSANAPPPHAAASCTPPTATPPGPLEAPIVQRFEPSRAPHGAAVNAEAERAALVAEGLLADAQRGGALLGEPHIRAGGSRRGGAPVDRAEARQDQILGHVLAAQPRGRAELRPRESAEMWCLCVAWGWVERGLERG